jgi:hypothetical protein
MYKHNKHIQYSSDWLKVKQALRYLRECEVHLQKNVKCLNVIWKILADEPVEGVVDHNEANSHSAI